MESQQEMTVSPATAREWLDRFGNSRNRTINYNLVRNYAEMMANGHWKCSGEFALSFNDAGMLLNGHHRLRAVIAYDHPVRFVVRKGVSSDVLRYTDMFGKRSVNQVAKMVGIDTSFDPGLRIIYCVRTQETRSPGLVQMERLREEYARAAELLRPLTPIRVAGKVVRAGVIGGFLAILSKHPDEATRFIGEFSGVAARTVDGTAATKNLVRWIENKLGNAGAAAQFGSIGAVINAFEQYMKGTTFQYVKGGSGIGDSTLSKYLNNEAVQESLPS